MKILIPLATLFFVLNLNADVISGDTIRQYSKPGAPINMKYDSNKVDVNEIADINIRLSTTVDKGKLSVIITLDKKLKNLSNVQKYLSLDIYPSQQKTSINLQVSAEEEGLYYIRLLTKIENDYGIKLRSFAVPVYIGSEKKKILPKGIGSSFKALDSGENISVSKAIETIKVLEKNN